ncbi:hypothetical protein C8Q76DRAFT_734611 [Earliella scabrosa]|nr:hypothetical protein C8Q76DRAFT_734611 [Earliella scabrosa]
MVHMSWNAQVESSRMHWAILAVRLAATATQFCLAKTTQCKGAVHLHSPSWMDELLNDITTWSSPGIRLPYIRLDPDIPFMPDDGRPVRISYPRASLPSCTHVLWTA